jgi:hypothetical protein
MARHVRILGACTDAFARAGALLGVWVAVACGALTAGAQAYSVSTDCQAKDSDYEWCLRNGAHNWTLGETQNWGLSENGNGGGYSAQLGVATFTSGLEYLGDSLSTAYYTVQKPGSNQQHALNSRRNSEGQAVYDSTRSVSELAG